MSVYRTAELPSQPKFSFLQRQITSPSPIKRAVANFLLFLVMVFDLSKIIAKNLYKNWEKVLLGFAAPSIVILQYYGFYQYFHKNYTFPTDGGTFASAFLATFLLGFVEVIIIVILRGMFIEFKKDYMKDIIKKEKNL